MRQKNVAVLFGGCSPEYEVSLASASAVISHMDQSLFQTVLIGITREGNWYYYPGDVSRIENDTWHDADCFPACLSPDRSRHALLVYVKRNQLIPVDVVFPVLHGRNGEDGTVQGLCELAGIHLAGAVHWLPLCAWTKIAPTSWCLWRAVSASLPLNWYCPIIYRNEWKNGG
jgi:D-alanine---D-serine ligase